MSTVRRLLFLTLLSICYGDQWLMEGDFIPELEALRRGLLLESTNSTTSVSASMRVDVSAPPGYSINCVMAAALHMHGEVGLLSGGVGFDKASLTYRSLSGKPDLFFVLVESHAEEALRLRDDAAEMPRLAILYDRFRGWTGGGVDLARPNLGGQKARKMVEDDEIGEELAESVEEDSDEATEVTEKNDDVREDEEKKDVLVMENDAR
ncbi:hypothetical protein QAD02_009953 [Eretmocerus hayati]|uniref:Uncharacterized protein n=1 Tax=Eretmocerus hayati TaxID=131215 RepID=A0ACC2NAS8_9HYME|nr:hypothetical protein QAD02_009953 [Eretmocerus hayati]